jgi:ubiquinone/menaquinone biosynthesis C-methylase UbiE
MPTDGETMAQRDNDALSFWNDRSKLGVAAGSNDIIAKQMEIKAIASYVRTGMRILDFGCGNGITAIEIAKHLKVDILGIDYAQAMITAAEGLAETATLTGRVRFQVGDDQALLCIHDRFDLVYTERTLINLRDWESQRRAIANLTFLLNPGGIYVMCENSQEGLDAINDLRHQLGLKRIAAPWHNRYLRKNEIESIDIPGVTLEEVNHYSSTYYLLSRVLNAALAAKDGLEPAYDAPINQLALNLPPLGQWGQGKIWVWRKDVH